MLMITRFKLIFIAVLSLPLLSYGDENGLVYKFIQADSSYMFHGSFEVKAYPDSNRMNKKERYD